MVGAAAAALQSAADSFLLGVRLSQIIVLFNFHVILAASLWFRVCWLVRSFMNPLGCPCLFFLLFPFPRLVACLKPQDLGSQGLELNSRFYIRREALIHLEPTCAAFPFDHMRSARRQEREQELLPVRSIRIRQQLHHLHMACSLEFVAKTCRPCLRLQVKTRTTWLACLRALGWLS